MDPYDVAAARLPTRTRAAIASFWEGFAANAEGLDRLFSGAADGPAAAPVDVMAPLATVSPDLMWEFGPSDRGHHLCITAEWQDANRPLARAMRNMAPDLPRWTFGESRAPLAPEHVANGFASRFPQSQMPRAVTATVGKGRRIDLTITPADPKQPDSDGTLGLISMLLGEDVERDWIGFIDPEAPPSALKGLLSRGSTARPDPAAILAALQTAIAAAKASRADAPYAAQPLENRAVTLFKMEPVPDGPPRSDLFSYAATDPELAHGLLSRQRFASNCHSAHGEWFAGLAIPRTADMPFDQVDDRYDLEERIHALLSADGLGGSAGAGHGTNHVYIDFATIDVAQAIARLEQALGDLPGAAAIRVHFFDTGLTDLQQPLLTGASLH